MGLEGAQLSAMEAAWLRLLRPGGVILFRRNIESAAQTQSLLHCTQQAVESPMLRCIDVEGGSVDRLRDLIAPMPSPFAVAATNKPALFKKHGSLIGQEVHLLGLNTTFAPVLDLRTDASANVMTTRVVSADPAQVIRYATHFLEGLAQHECTGLRKALPRPGQRAGGLPPHHSLDHQTSQPALERRSAALPELATQLPMVMISHASYPAAVPEPASVSGYWITEVLVREIGYQGLIVSDDMEMGGILNYMGIADAAIRSLAAGMHVVEICRNPVLVFAAYEALLHEAETSPAFARVLRRAATRAQALHTMHLKRDALPPAPTAAAVDKMRSAVEKFTEQVARA